MAPPYRAGTTLVLLLGSAAVAGIHALGLSTKLPERVAAHFTASGQANGWMTRDAFVASYAILVAVMTLMIAGSGAAIAAQPDAKIRLPNRGYWLHPSRREATLDWLRAWMHLFGAAINLLLIRVMQLVVRANLDGSSRIDSSIESLVGVFLAFTLGMVAWMYVHFQAAKD